MISTLSRFAFTALILTLPALAQIPAFPGAEGFGAHANGGRGGDVYTVTNLNSSGAGSLAEGIASAPGSGRTIIFAVSGTSTCPGRTSASSRTISPSPAKPPPATASA